MAVPTQQGENFVLQVEQLYRRKTNQNFDYIIAGNTDLKIHFAELYACKRWLTWLSEMFQKVSLEFCSTMN